MIINIRGTSGSGKSTLVRNVLELYARRYPVKVDGRKQPIGYIYQMEDPLAHAPLAVIGHYETPCGGCDTIANMDEIYNRVRAAHAQKMDVLYEGLLISADANRAVALHTDGLPVLVVGLNTPLAICLQSVNQRRYDEWNRRRERIAAANLIAAQAGKRLEIVPEYKGDVNPKNTTSKFSGVKSSMKRLEAAGVRTAWASRDEAFELIKKELVL